MYIADQNISSYLDRKELENRIEGSQKVLSGEVKEEEGVESEGDADVVDEGGVEVSLPWGPVTIVVKIKSL